MLSRDSLCFMAVDTIGNTCQCSLSQINTHLGHQFSPHTPGLVSA